jgi:hypothetical protein
MNAVPDRIASLLRHAIAAPSSHNTQPWLFRVDDDGIELIADRTRALPVNDPFDRELTISCGCALAGIEAGALSVGLPLDVELFPDGPDADLLARVRVGAGGGRAGGGEGTSRLPARCTHRGAVDTQPPSAEVVQRLVDIVATADCLLSPLGTDVRDPLADLVEAGDRAQWGDPHWRRELAAWMHPRRRGDGLGLPSLAAPLARLFVGALDLGGMVGPRDRAAVMDAPLLVLLSTSGDTPADWLAAGRGLQRCLLEAASEGLQAAYFNQPIQVATLRPHLASLCAGRWPQVLFRLGRPVRAGGGAARRPLAEVIEGPRLS